MKRWVGLVYIILLSFIFMGIVSADANLKVNGFSCTPSEVAINDVFSCTATVINNGDAAGNLNTVRLEPDSSSWLEQSNYVQTYGSSIGVGQTAEITFSGIRATKAGNNGFSRVTLDSVSDTYVADNNIKVNVIDISVKVTNSASSAIMGATFTSTPEVTAGGNIDATLTINIDSGGCSIGNQNSQKSTTGLTNQQKWTSSAWTITQGTSGSCRFTITGQAIGKNGVASKSISVSNTITCTDCPVSSSSSDSGSGAGGAGGGAGGSKVVELTQSISRYFGEGESLVFSFGGLNHSVKVQNITETSAVIIVQSSPKIFTLQVGQEEQVDFEQDGKNDISVKLHSINLITKKALLVINPLYVPSTKPSSEEEKETEAGKKSSKEEFDKGTESGKDEEGKFSTWMIVVIILLVVAILIVVLSLIVHYQQIKKHRRMMVLTHGRHHDYHGF